MEKVGYPVTAAREYIIPRTSGASGIREIEASTNSITSPSAERYKLCKDDVGLMLETIAPHVVAETRLQNGSDECTPIVNWVVHRKLQMMTD